MEMVETGLTSVVWKMPLYTNSADWSDRLGISNWLHDWKCIASLSLRWHKAEILSMALVCSLHFQCAYMVPWQQWKCLSTQIVDRTVRPFGPSTPQGLAYIHVVINGSCWMLIGNRCWVAAVLKLMCDLPTFVKSCSAHFVALEKETCWLPVTQRL